MNNLTAITIVLCGIVIWATIVFIRDTFLATNRPEHKIVEMGNGKYAIKKQHWAYGWVYVYSWFHELYWIREFDTVDEARKHIHELIMNKLSTDERQEIETILFNKDLAVRSGGSCR